MANRSYSAAVSLPRPAAASAYPGRDGVWPRRLLALMVGAAVSAAAATALLRAPSFELHDLNLIVWLLIGARLLEKKWSRRRSARLVWRPRVVGTYGENGPTEVAIVADDSADATYVAADLIAQAEHSPGVAILVTWYPPLLDEVQEALRMCGVDTRRVAGWGRLFEEAIP